MPLERRSLMPSSNSRAEPRPADELGGGAMRARTWASQPCGPTPFILAVTIKLYSLRRAARRDKSKSDASQASFGGVVGETHAAVLQEQREARPTLQDVVERLGQVVCTVGHTSMSS